MLAALTVVVRLPFLTRPASPDEGGLLLVAGQWSPGRSLYGDYWVDRPPLLVAFFAVADHLGGLVALRVLALALVAGSVGLAGRIGGLAVGEPGRARLRASVAAAGLATLLLCQPRFGVFQVDGELVAAPAVLGGFALVLAAARERHSRRVLGLLAGAGACAAVAVLVKQNEIDVVVLLVVALLTGRPAVAVSRRHAAAAVASGGAAVTVVTLAGAVLLGTRLARLWEAVVTFRLAASGVIARSATAATSDRLHVLLLAAVLAGLPLLLLRALANAPLAPRPGVPDLRIGVVAVLAWESVSVVAGGSYWTHYLICLVPGLVMAEALAATVDRPRWSGRPALALALAGLACAWSLVPTWVEGVAGEVSVLAGHPAPVDPTVAWLRAHTRPGDSALVAYGHPDLLQAAGLRSPYPELWSLPVRVRDPHLVRLTRVLASHRRPTWIVTGPGGDLAGWGIDARVAELYFRVLYEPVADLGGTRVFRVRPS